jgi:uncharacterized membrane protein
MEKRDRKVAFFTFLKEKTEPSSLSTPFLAVMVIKWVIMGFSGGKWELLKNMPIFIPRLYYANRKVHSRPRS